MCACKRQLLVFQEAFVYSAQVMQSEPNTSTVEAPFISALSLREIRGHVYHDPSEILNFDLFSLLGVADFHISVPATVGFSLMFLLISQHRNLY